MGGSLMLLDAHSESFRFKIIVLGGWWAAAAALGLFRLWDGDAIEASILLVSASLAVFLGTAVDFDRQRAGEADDDGRRLARSVSLFAVIAAATAVACSVLNHATRWGLIECAALSWVVVLWIQPPHEDIAARTVQP